MRDTVGAWKLMDWANFKYPTPRIKNRDEITWANISTFLQHLLPQLSKALINLNDLYKVRIREKENYRYHKINDRTAW